MQILAARTASRSPSNDPLVHLDQHPDIIAIDEKIAAYRARQADAKERGDRAKHAANIPKPTRSATERADLLVRGGTIPSSEPQAEISAAEEEQRVLASAICTMTEERQEIASRLCCEASQRVRDKHVAAFRKLDAALASSHGALVELVSIDQGLREAGYTPNSTVLPSHIPASLWQLGDPDRPGCQAWMFRQWFIKTLGGGA